jgi:pimeloyl-ACP methyl ester carboxylesterase
MTVTTVVMEKGIETPKPQAVPSWSCSFRASVVIVSESPSIQPARSFQIEFLHALGYRTLAFDYRGHGRSSLVESPERLGKLRPQTFADDAAALLDHLGIAPAIVLHHSMGTITASTLMIQHPVNVTMVILSDLVYNMPWEMAS